ncbi:hypothetical protein M231_04846 [Tremella mesenterica]|uniref:Uncharacterized protein n=1 Tax=Tremella mesenterica TaxID=5217 RepID=A0A4Q1BJG2_TREME|nr:uncharacterized protein TREMEDRAFT_66239 [Tremella mesenterica DSM 1558]EIW65872.1 hypothetical protein TREMEDRAFT_66239 [Tremella mesenterica DSM 1558]RXK37848.1 hypothetical protein M231_04846 [Tremella mesenterica]
MKLLFLVLTVMSAMAIPTPFNGQDENVALQQRGATGPRVDNTDKRFGDFNAEQRDTTEPPILDGSGGSGPTWRRDSGSGADQGSGASGGDQGSASDGDGEGNAAGTSSGGGQTGSGSSSSGKP